jgi:hypothetical protein
MRWIIDANFNLLSLAAFPPLTLWQALSSRFFGNTRQNGRDQLS